MIDKFDAEDFLLKKSISNHPRVEDVDSKNSYEVAELMAEFANETNSVIMKSTNGGLTEREKSLIFWFMELAVRMKIKGYTELSIASIDLDAWYKDYYCDNVLPLTALEMEELEGV